MEKAGDMSESQPKQRFPSWKQALVILCSGIVLGACSCAVFLVTASLSDKLAWFFAAGFFAGVVGTLVGVILVLIRAIRGPGSKS